MSNDSNHLPAYHVPNTTSGSYEPPLVVNNRYIDVTGLPGMGTLSASQEVVFTTVLAAQPAGYMRASLIESDMEKIRAIIREEVQRQEGFIRTVVQEELEAHHDAYYAKGKEH